MAQSDPMIDLTLDYHAHILPRCDHGSDGVETSLRQLAMAAEAGIRTVCATPHFYPHRENAAAFLEQSALRRGAAAQAGASAHPAGGRGPDLRWHGAA